MKLKYLSKSSISNQKEEIFETPFLDYFEDTEGKFIVIKFKDQNKVGHHLKISNDEIIIFYNGNKIHLIKNYRVSTNYSLGNKTIEIDWFLKTVKINKREILFNYDILQKDNIVTSNEVSLIIENL
ncbi:hypothetical protein [Metamycoplasma buccale]|uniref:hypothetical protein n=1 Tax=Metamycoplasma buccale TaxID=55602 RepID=UPI00398EECFA